MSLAQKTFHAGVVAYLLALFVCLAFAFIKLDFTGYQVGRVGLLIIMVTTCFVGYRFMIVVMKNLKMHSHSL
jgi:hypothetical protein